MSLTRFAPVAALVTCAVLWAAPVASVAQKVDLRPKFKQGQEHRFTMQTLENSAEVSDTPDEGRKQTVNQTVVLLMKTKEVGSEQSIVDLVYESLKLKVDGAMSMEFDSTKPEDTDGDNPFAESLRPVVGTTLTLTIDKDGNIISVTGGDKLKQMGGMTAEMAEQKNLSGLIGPIFSTRASSGQATVGESWTHVDELGATPFGNLKMTTKHTLESHKGSTALVQIEGMIESDQDGLIKESKNTGSYEWDTELGMLRRLNLKQNTALDVFGTMLKSEQTVKIERAS